MFCEKCGKLIDSDVNFCPNCGNVLKKPDYNTDYSTNSSSENNANYNPNSDMSNNTNYNMNNNANYNSNNNTNYFELLKRKITKKHIIVVIIILIIIAPIIYFSLPSTKIINYLKDGDYEEAVDLYKDSYEKGESDFLLDAGLLAIAEECEQNFSDSEIEPEEAMELMNAIKKMRIDSIDKKFSKIYSKVSGLAVMSALNGFSVDRDVTIERVEEEQNESVASVLYTTANTALISNAAKDKNGRMKSFAGTSYGVKCLKGSVNGNVYWKGVKIYTDKEASAAFCVAFKPEDSDIIYVYPPEFCESGNGRAESFSEVESVLHNGFKVCEFNSNGKGTWH